MRIVANQLEFSGGSRRDRSELLTDAEQLLPPTTVQKKGSLFLALEPDDLSYPIPKADLELAHAVQKTIVEEFYNYNGSTVTSAMRSAIEKANQFLFNQNSHVPPHERRGFGLSCVVVRGSELYLAQIPPTQAILVHQKQLKYFPTPPDRVPGPRPVTNPPADNASPAAKQGTGSLRRAAPPSLGRYTTIEPNLMRNVFEESDIFILITTELLRSLRNEQTENLFLKQNGRDALVSLSDWMRNEQVKEGHSLAISAVSDFAVSNHSYHSRSTYAATPSDEYEYLDSEPFDEFRPPDQRRTAPSPVLHTNPVAAAVSPEAVSIPTESDAPESGKVGPWIRHERDALNQPPYLRNKPPSPPDSEKITATEPAQVAVNAEAENFSQPTAAQPRIKRGQPQARVKFNQASDTPFFGVSDNFGPPFEQIAGRRFSLNRAVLNPTELWTRYKFFIIGVVAVILVLSVALIMAGNISKNTQQHTNTQNFVQQAEIKRSQAEQLASSSDPNDLDQARQLINAARTDLGQAKTLEPNNTAIIGEATKIDQTLNLINKVTIPTDIRLTYDLTALGAGVDVEQAVLTPDGKNLFLLDKGLGQVYLLNSDGQSQPKTILKSGQTANGQTFSKPVAMTNRLDSVLVVDDKNVAWVYNIASSSWSSTVLGGSETWTKPVKAIATYEGNLYVIGEDSNQILRYLAGNYGSKPDEWLDPTATAAADLDQAAAFAIDGNIYALTPDNKLLTMARPSGSSTGKITQQSTISGTTIDPPLNNPTSLNPGNFDYPYIFVVDGEKRVLQISKKDGTLVQQLETAPGNVEFAKVRDVALDTKNNRLYIVGQQQIYSFSLTQPQNTASQSGGAITVEVSGAKTTAPVSSTSGS